MIVVCFKVRHLPVREAFLFFHFKTKTGYSCRRSRRLSTGESKLLPIIPPQVFIKIEVQHIKRNHASRVFQPHPFFCLMVSYFMNHHDPTSAPPPVESLESDFSILYVRPKLVTHKNMFTRCRTSFNRLLKPIHTNYRTEI